jgi:hypothetical protein
MMVFTKDEPDISCSSRHGEHRISTRIGEYVIWGTVKDVQNVGSGNI